jgi:hypothetical protein
MCLSELYEKYARERGYKDWNTFCACVSWLEFLDAKEIVRRQWKELKNVAR